MNNLIAELERATEGSRETDITIARLMGHQLRVGPWMAAENPMEPDYPATIPVPFYTTSLDAARTLGSEDARWKVGDGKGGPYASVGGPRIYEAATPILALCIAALRERQAMVEIG